MPGPQNSSLPISFQGYPYSVWRSYAKTYNEYMVLLKIFRGVPQNWIEWAERRVLSSEKRGVIIKNPLEYRVSILWNGIISLQESKFICDVLENAFRQSVIEFIITRKIIYDEIEIANWKKFRDKFVFLPNTVVPSGLILNMTLGELTETMLLNWSSVRRAKDKPGFSEIFLNNPICLIEHIFRKDMGRIKRYRNLIAHSNKLLNISESQKLFERVNFWLTPLQVDLKQKVLAYRDKRPMFLHDVVMH